MRLVPETANRSDWARLVAQAVNEGNRRIDALQGPFAFRTVTATGNLTAGDYLVLANANSGAITLTLPAVATSAGAFIIVKKTDASANAVTVDGSGAETIDGAATQAITAQYDAVTVACDGTGWWIV